ncbi:hypothetical protein GGI03_000859 [Coemansia sp. RSA 2337]|nr:hypothetical protein GGI09_005067 [Coemansia sp. S100]KAJ2114194.1 hypothetical protein IW146_003270 [Coemansia sp. RSA 922]KAJ2468644.1 hypothetical protein GGI03_000859 [Coemansia sp. RSA 2337]
MAEVIAYEDSPLAQYLRDIDASETFVAEDKPETTDSAADKSLKGSLSDDFNLCKWLSRQAARSSDAQDSHKIVSTIVKEMHARFVSALADSGLVAERYTPRPCRIALKPLGVNIPALFPSSTLGIVGLFVMLNMPSVFICAPLAFRPGGLGGLHWGIVLTLFLLMLGNFAISVLMTGQSITQLSQRRVPIGKCDEALENFNGMVLKCRAMDSTVQRALRVVMDVDFVARGFRLPQYRGSQAIASATGRGSAWMAEHVRQAIDSALSLSIDTLADIIERPKQQSQQGEMESFLDSDTRMCMADLRAQLGDGSELEPTSLEALKHKFAVHFAMRKLWLESVIRTLESYTDDDIRSEQLLPICELLVPGIVRVSETAGLSANRVKEASEAQYTARKWASLAATKADSTGSHHPLVRSLSSMSEALETVRAKILVCRECVSMVEDDVVGSEDRQAVPSPEEIARVFASLKPDIDALNHLYQASVTSLAFYDSGSEPASSDKNDSTSTVPAELTDFELGLTTIPEGTTVFGYTPFGGDSLDAPEQIFEADIEQETGQGRLKSSNIDRSERIRLSKQKRAEEQVASTRKNDIVYMMSELKTAIDSRSKTSTKKDTSKE